MLAILIIAPMVSATDEPATISLSGHGQEASQKFTLTEGLSIFTMKHLGSSNFAVWLMDGNGEKVELLANAAGDFMGAKGVGIFASGDYFLDIAANGPWTMDITQPKPETAQSVPVSFSGMGPQVSQFFTLNPGLATFKTKHNGENNFIIWLLDSKGNKIDLLVNETGKFDGSKATDIKDGGIYCLDIDAVDADGNWKIYISQ
jgi:hypothetical protein